MWVDKVLKCPDEGTAYQLISVTEDGETKVEAYLTKEQAEPFLYTPVTDAPIEVHYNGEHVTTLFSDHEKME
jgi:hypothetical protein